MRRILCFFVCLFVFNLYGNGNVATNKELNVSSLYQKGDWESLGDISAVSQYGKIEPFGLFIKSVNGKEFYQVRPSKIYRVGEIIPKYSVTLGNYIFKGVKYNAKFSIYSTTYYFNI